MLSTKRAEGKFKANKSGLGEEGKEEGVPGGMAVANLLWTHSGIFLLEPLFTTLPVVLCVLIFLEALKSTLYTGIFFGFQGVEEVVGFVTQLSNITGLQDEICLSSCLGAQTTHPPPAPPALSAPLCGTGWGFLPVPVRRGGLRPPHSFCPWSACECWGILTSNISETQKAFQKSHLKTNNSPPPLHCTSDSQTSPLVFIPPPWLVFAVPFMLVTYLTSWRSQSLLPYSSGPALLFIPEDSLVLGSQGLIQELALDLIPRSSVH